MTSTTARPETYLPEAGEAEEIAAVGDYLEAASAGRAGAARRVFLSSAGTDEVIEVPEELYRVMRHVANALRHGLAVTVAPQDTTLTTQQAAELLGISRPTLIKLLETGDLRHGLVGTHRRLALGDVLAYRERRRRRSTPRSPTWPARTSPTT